MAAILNEASIRAELRVESSVFKDLDKTGDGLVSSSDDFVRFVNNHGIKIVCFFESQQSEISKLTPGGKTAIPTVRWTRSPF
jgi:hypothetical protein